MVGGIAELLSSGRSSGSVEDGLRSYVSRMSLVHARGADADLRNGIHGARRHWAAAQRVLLRVGCGSAGRPRVLGAGLWFMLIARGNC